jgi:hypothetical protein
MRPKDPSGNVLQDSERLCSQQAESHERLGDIADTGQQSAPENRRQRVRP